MDDQKLEQIARDIEELKSAVRRNDPLMRAVLTTRGWGALGLGGGLGVTLFALPAHFLSRAYGSFAAIPTPLKALVWAALGLAIVGGGAWKLALIARRASEVDSNSGLGELFDSFFGATSIHVTGAMLVAILVSIAWAVWAGRPWLALPATGVVMGVWMNAIGSQTRVPEYLVAGWWSLLSGSAGLFLVELSPFLWVLAIYGGMFYAFGVAAPIIARRRGGGRA